MRPSVPTICRCHKPGGRFRTGIAETGRSLYGLGWAAFCLSGFKRTDWESGRSGGWLVTSAYANRADIRGPVSDIYSRTFFGAGGCTRTTQQASPDAANGSADHQSSSAIAAASSSSLRVRLDAPIESSVRMAACPSISFRLPKSQIPISRATRSRASSSSSFSPSSLR